MRNMSSSPTPQKPCSLCDALSLLPRSLRALRGACRGLVLPKDLCSM